MEALEKRRRRELGELNGGYGAVRTPMPEDHPSSLLHGSFGAFTLAPV